jgi:hypothetical protein
VVYEVQVQLEARDVRVHFQTHPNARDHHHRDDVVSDTVPVGCGSRVGDSKHNTSFTAWLDSLPHCSNADHVVHRDLTTSDEERISGLGVSISPGVGYGPRMIKRSRIRIRHSEPEDFSS